MTSKDRASHPPHGLDLPHFSTTKNHLPFAYLPPTPSSETVTSRSQRRKRDYLDEQAQQHDDDNDRPAHDRAGGSGEGELGDLTLCEVEGGLLDRDGRQVPTCLVELDVGGQVRGDEDGLVEHGRVGEGAGLALLEEDGAVAAVAADDGHVGYHAVLHTCCLLREDILGELARDNLDAPLGGVGDAGCGRGEYGCRQGGQEEDGGGEWVLHLAVVWRWSITFAFSAIDSFSPKKISNEPEVRFNRHDIASLDPRMTDRKDRITKE